MKNFTILLLALMLVPCIGMAQWEQVGSHLEGLTDDNGLWFGYDVALSADGSTMVVGAPHATGTGLNENDSYAEVYRYTDGDWQLLGNKIEGAEHFIQNAISPHGGQSVAISHDGNTVAIGETYFYMVYEDELTATSGRVRIFELVDGDWVQIGGDIMGVSVDENGNYDLFETGHLRFGDALALSADGNIVAVGDYNAKNPNGLETGKVSVFQNVDNEWVQMGINLYGEIEDEKYGTSLDLSADGTVLAVGAIEGEGDVPGPNDPGYVKIYEYQSGEWQEIGRIDGLESDDGWGRGNYAGASVALSDDGTVVAFAGSQYRNADEEYVGNVRVYQNVDGVWEPKGDMFEGGKTTHVNSKSLVDLSADGNILAFGTNGGSWPPPATQGKIEVYSYTGSDWELVDEIISPDSPMEEEARFGSVVSISSDGSVLGLGVFTANIDGVSDVGMAKVYQNCNISSVETPEVTIPQTLCAGETAELSATISSDFYADGTLEWYESPDAEAPFFTGPSWETSDLIETTSYWVLAATRLGCNSGLVEVVVTVNPLPETPTGETNQSYSVESTIADLDITADGELTWYADPELTEVLDPSEDLIDGTTYYVTQTIDGCESEPLAITVQSTVGIQNTIIEGFTFFPNPATNHITLVSEMHPVMSYRLTDLTGKVVKDDFVNGLTRLDIPVNSLTQGVYLLEIRTENNSATYKMMKR